MANLKFSQFTEQTDTSNVQFIVGYNGATNVRISPANIIGGTVTSVTTGNANTITIGGTSAAPTVAANTAAVTNGSANLATGDQIYDFVIAQGYTTNIGTVTSVGLAMPAAFSVASSPVSTSGTLTVTGAGTTAQYIRGDGTLNTFPTIPTVPTNIVETVTTTDGTFINLTPNTATDGAVTVTADLSATGTPSSSNYLRGDNTWATIPGGFTSFDITGGSGSAQTITNGNTITLAQGTGISTVAGTTDTVTITNTLPFNSLTLAGDSGASQSITNNNTITLAGGTGLSSVASATDTVTFNANVDGVQSVAANTSTTTAARTYKVQVDSSDNLVVNVPWTSGSSGIGGSIASQQIAFGTGTNTIGGESDLIYNSSNNTLSVGGGTGSGSIYTTGNVTAEASLILGAYVYHNGDTNTRFGFPANDTFIIDTNGSERMRVASTGAVQLNTYGSGTFTGTAAYALSVDSSGNIIETTGGAGYTPQVLTTSTTGQKDYLYILTGGSAITLTMPSSPSAGDSIKVSNLTTVNTCAIDPAFENLMGLGQSMTLDNNNASFELIYTNSTQGWVVIGATSST